MIRTLAIVIDVALLALLWSAWQSLAAHDRARVAVVVYASAFFLNVLALLL